MSNILRSFAETKARKALLRLGLTPVNGVERVTFTVALYKKVYAILHPQVFKNYNGGTYIVFGELTFESGTNVESSYVCSEQAFTVIDVNVEKEEASSGTTNAESGHKMTEEKETIAIFDIEEEDIQIVIQQTRTTGRESDRSTEI